MGMTLAIYATSILLILAAAYEMERLLERSPTESGRPAYAMLAVCCFCPLLGGPEALVVIAAGSMPATIFMGVSNNRAIGE